MKTVFNQSRFQEAYYKPPESLKHFETEKSGTVTVICHNVGGFTSSRQRWWYIAVANCGSNKGMDIRYKFKMTNGATGDFWHEHFSADEMCKICKKKN